MPIKDADDDNLIDGERWVHPSLIPSPAAPPPKAVESEDEYIPEDEVDPEETASVPEDGITQPAIGDEEAFTDFLLSFFALVGDPTDKQIHLLAEILNMSPETLERSIYSMLGQAVQELEDGDQSENFEQVDDDIELSDA